MDTLGRISALFDKEDNFLTSFFFICLPVSILESDLLLK